MYRSRYGTGDTFQGDFIGWAYQDFTAGDGNQISGTSVTISANDNGTDIGAFSTSYIVTNTAVIEAIESGVSTAKKPRTGTVLGLFSTVVKVTAHSTGNTVTLSGTPDSSFDCRLWYGYTYKWGPPANYTIPSRAIAGNFLTELNHWFVTEEEFSDGSRDAVFNSINNTIIGNTTPAAGTFTNISGTGTADFNSLTVGGISGTGDWLTTGDVTCEELILTLPGAAQNYKFTTTGTIALQIQGQSPNTDAVIQFYTTTGDAGDYVGLRFFGLGTPGSITNSESLVMQWDEPNAQYIIKTHKTGSTGVVERPLILQAGGNTGQLTLAIDGTASLAGLGFVEQVAGYDINGGSTFDKKLELRNDCTINQSLQTTDAVTFGGLTINGETVIENAYIIRPDDGFETAYAWLKDTSRNVAMGALSATNRRVLVLAPGVYTISSPPFDLDTDYLDIVALAPAMGGQRQSTDVEWDGAVNTATVNTGGHRPPPTLVTGSNSDTTISAGAVITQSASNVRLHGFGIANTQDPGSTDIDTNAESDIYASAFCITAADVSASCYSMMYFWMTGAGVWHNADQKWMRHSAYSTGDFKGKWEHCLANGHGYRCAATYDFAPEMYDCVSGGFSYAGDESTVEMKNCTLYRCKAVGHFNTAHEDAGGGVVVRSGYASFGGCRTYGCNIDSTAYLYDCEAGDKSYGMAKVCSGNFYRCIGGADCFGGYRDTAAVYGTFSGYAVDCEASRNSFGTGHASCTFAGIVARHKLPVGWWQLNNSVFVDSSGMGNDATAYGHATTASDILELDGTGDYLDIDVVAADVPAEGTILLWVNPHDNTKNDQYIFSLRTSGGERLYLRNHAGDFEVGWKATYNFDTTYNFTQDEWVQIGITWKDNDCWSWVNGTQQSTHSSGSGEIGTFNEAGIGCSCSAKTTTAYHFNGDISDVRVYDYVFLPSEIQRAYDEGKRRFAYCNNITIANDLTMKDAGNIILESTTGTKIATATTQKLGFFNATPVTQRAKADYNNWGAFGDVVDALVSLGLFDQA